MSDYNAADDHDRPRFEGEGEAGFDRPSRSNGMALAALVLGIVSLCTGFLVGIPAIICGALGLSRAKHVGGVGQGMAIAGLVLGIIGTVVMPFIAIALLLPAVQKVREAAARTTDMNSLKIIALAHHNYEGAYNRFSPPYVLSKDGQPNRGLSWRVSLLPFIENDNVYRMFDLKQPWDSPTNWPASQSFIRTYQSPADPLDNQTRIRVFVGPGTMFEDSPEWQDSKPTLAHITDGIANTLMAVETTDRVPWAANQEIPYQPGAPLPKLGHPNRNVALVVMADGSVRMVKKNISPQILHGLITRNGGEAVTADDLGK